MPRLFANVVCCSIASSIVILAASCGTYSAIRPADNLRRGQFEVAGGLAASQVGQVLPVVRATVGVSDEIEIGGQYEVYSALASIRFAAMRTETHGLALAVGLEGGVVSLVDDIIDGDTDFGLRAEAGGASLAVGHRWSSVEGYFATKALIVGWDGDTSSFLGTYRAGARFGGTGLSFGFELGGTLHHTLFIAESTAYIAFGL